MGFDLGFDVVDYLLVGAAAVSGLIHLYKGFNSGFLLLTLAGAGFLGGIILYLVGFHRFWVVAASIPFTLAQFVFYYRFYGFNFGFLGGLDKFVQLVFVLSAVYFLVDEGSVLERYLSF
jgi:hypothetical protein